MILEQNKMNGHITLLFSKAEAHLVTYRACVLLAVAVLGCDSFFFFFFLSKLLVLQSKCPMTKKL